MARLFQRGDKPDKPDKPEKAPKAGRGKDRSEAQKGRHTWDVSGEEATGGTGGLTILPSKPMPSSARPTRVEPAMPTPPPPAEWARPAAAPVPAATERVAAPPSSIEAAVREALLDEPTIAPVAADLVAGLSDGASLSPAAPEPTPVTWLPDDLQVALLAEADPEAQRAKARVCLRALRLAVSAAVGPPAAPTPGVVLGFDDGSVLTLERTTESGRAFTAIADILTAGHPGD